MSTDKTGGFAFPHPGTRTLGGDDFHVYPELGMTLRDYFAAKALPAIIAADGIQYAGNSKSWGEHAAMAYAHADAMLAERQK